MEQFLGILEFFAFSIFFSFCFLFFNSGSFIFFVASRRETFWTKCSLFMFLACFLGLWRRFLLFVGSCSFFYSVFSLRTPAAFLSGISAARFRSSLRAGGFGEILRHLFFFLFASFWGFS